VTEDAAAQTLAATRGDGDNDDGKLFPVTTDDIRARQHPRAVIALWAWHTALALAAAWPAASLVRAAYGPRARGDAPLWDEGGHALVDFLWHASWGLSPVVATGEVVLAVGAVAGLLPMAAVMTTMAYTFGDRQRPELARCVLFSLRSLPALLVLLLVVTAAQAAVIGLGLGAAAAAQSLAEEALGVARSEKLGVAIAVVFVVVASGVGVLHDLARAAVIRKRTSWLRAFSLGARTFAHAPLPLWWSWAWRTLGSIAPVLVVGGVSAAVDSRRGLPLVLIAVLHQTVIVARASLHASWWAETLRSLDRLPSSSARGE
jgi:hypothetical protein